MRGDWAAGLMALGTVAATPADAQGPAMPALSAQGIARTVVLCLVADDGPDRLDLQRRLCEQVRAVAADGAPVPVATIGFGDPVLLRRDVLGVLVHAAVDRRGATPVVVLSVRPHRSAPGTETFFGATPVAVPLGAGGTMPDAALAAALDQILPWRMPARR